MSRPRDGATVRPARLVRAVVFDLDGVIVSTDELHFRAWTEIADSLGIPFDRSSNERLRGVSRMESLELLLGDRAGEFDARAKAALAERKNTRYQELLSSLSRADLLPGVAPLLAGLRARGVPMAIASSSRNAPAILERIDLTGFFDTVADGNRITASKPDAQVFLLAARDLDVVPGDCLAVEDASAGVEAAIAAGMRTAAVGSAASDSRADLSGQDIAAISAAILAMVEAGRS